MKLNPGERSILSYFPSRTRAEAALEELKEMGIEDLQIDRVSRFGVDHNDEINNPIAGRAETGTGLTFFSAGTNAFANNDTRVLMAADPTNNGYVSEGYGKVGGKAFMLGVVTSEEKVEQAVEIIKKHNGKV